MMKNIDEYLRWQVLRSTLMKLHLELVRIGAYDEAKHILTLLRVGMMYVIKPLHADLVGLLRDIGCPEVNPDDYPLALFLFQTRKMMRP